MGEQQLIKEAKRQEWARDKMVDEQLVSRGISDEKVLSAMRKVPRHLFVEQTYRTRAYEDFPLPIGEGQTISQPYMVASMSQSLKLTGSETVLEIGTGSGYQTAVLAELAARVYSVERVPSLTGRARKTLDDLGYKNVLVKLSDGTMGWKDYAPYDRILVTAGSPDIPEPLVEQLAEGGIMVIPVGSHSVQTTRRITKGSGGKLDVEKLEDCVFVKLIGRHGWEENGS
jgi:protein-L-isoaspartate(D-aspartate) O-methyltransferase